MYIYSQYNNLIHETYKANHNTHSRMYIAHMYRLLLQVSATPFKNNRSVLGR
jgi:hypothetical protein